MHEAAFARAALPAPCQVLGMMLRRYSLGHELWLQRGGFFEADTTHSNAALLNAVLICCQGWEQTRAMDADRLLRFKLFVWQHRLRRVDWEHESKAFESYREQGSIEFPLSDIVRSGSGPAARPPGAPFLLRLHQFLTIRLHQGEVEAWDYPLGLAKMQWAAYWEEEGGLQIYNFQDAEHDAFVATCEAEERAAAETVKAEIRTPAPGPTADSEREGGARA